MRLYYIESFASAHPVFYWATDADDAQEQYVADFPEAKDAPFKVGMVWANNKQPEYRGYIIKEGD